MGLKRCINGHNYNSNKYKTCPYCEADIVNTTRIIPTRFQKLGTLSFIGRGSMSRVFKISGTNKYALKVIFCGNNISKYSGALYELKIMHNLAECSRTTKLCDYEIADDGEGKTVYLLEKYYTPLIDYLSNKTIKISEIIRITISLCYALCKCKRVGILHLDIKTENLYIDDAKNVVIGDFSSALFIDDISVDHGLRGTPAYMAPEVYTAHLYSEQSDIYSVGIMLYTLLNNGRMPFTNTYNEDALIGSRLVDEPLPFLKLSSPLFDKKINRIIKSACSYDRMDRFQSFEELKDNLFNLFYYIIEKSTDDITIYSPYSPNSLFITNNTVEGSGYITAASSPDSSLNAYSQPGKPPKAGISDYISAPFIIPSIAFFPFSGILNFLTHKKSPKKDPNRTDAQIKANNEPARKVNLDNVNKSYDEYDEPSDVELKKVEFSVVAPKTLAKGDYSIINVVMYEKQFRDIVDNIIKEMEGCAQEIKSGIQKIKENSIIKVVLNSPDIIINDDTEIREWQGGYLNFYFTFLLPDNYEKQQVLFSALVYVNDLIAVKLNF